MPDMEHINPILGTVTKVKTLDYFTGQWQLVQCQQTGFVFLLDPPNYEELAEKFAWHKTFVQEKQDRQAAEPILWRLSQLSRRIRDTAFRDRDTMFSLAVRHLQPQQSLSLLDVGSGRGHRVSKFCEKFRRRGMKVVPCGIEVSRELAAISNSMFERLGGSVIAGTAYEGVASFPASSFDVVVMQCYLEHEVRPLEVLRRTHSILRNNGIVLVKVPNYNSINRWLRGARWCGFRLPDHVNYFTPKTLRLLAVQAGYEFQSQRLGDRWPTSDNMYAVLKKNLVAADAKLAA